MAASCQQRAHRIADGNAGHIGRDLIDHSRALEPEYVARTRRRRVAARALREVGTIHRAGQGEKAPQRPWDGAEGLEWEVPSPAPWHTFEQPPKLDATATRVIGVDAR